MDQVSLVKADVRKKQWAEIIQACQNSGMTVKAWCLENGINIKSYYYRLRKLREELCNSTQQVVPICSFSSSHFIVIRNGNVTAEIPDGISAATIDAVVRAVSQC